MRFSLLILLSVMLVLGLGLLISGASLADRGDASRARAETLVVGSFGCGDFQQPGRRESNRCFEFQGWEGLGRMGAPGLENQPLCVFFEARGDLGETCQGNAQEIRSVAQALGCVTGEIQVREDPGASFEEAVPFTWSGRRDHVVGTMAELSRAILELPL